MSTKNMDNALSFYERLMKLREAKGITIKQMDSDCTCQSKKWKEGHAPSLQAVCRLADYFCVSTDFLLGRGESVTQAEETSLIAKFRLLDDTQKSAVMILIDGFLQQIPSVKKAGIS